LGEGYVEITQLFYSSPKRHCSSPKLWFSSAAALVSPLLSSMIATLKTSHLANIITDNEDEPHLFSPSNAVEVDKVSK
jgi:hypothetical protein